MAEIREELTLIDKFTNIFGSYINLGDRAAKQSETVQKATDSVNQTYEMTAPAINKMAAATNESSVAQEKQAVIVDKAVKGVENLAEKVTQSNIATEKMTETTNESITAQEEQAKTIEKTAKETEAFVDKVIQSSSELDKMTGAVNESVVAHEEQAVAVEKAAREVENLTEKAARSTSAIENMNNSSMRAVSMISGIASQALIGDSAIGKMGISALNTTSRFVTLTGGTNAAKFAMIGATAAFAGGFALLNSQNENLKKVGAVIMGVAGALASFTLASKLAAIGLIPLNTALWANPIVLIGVALVGIIVGVAAALGAFSTESKNAADNVDDMTKSIEDMEKAMKEMSSTTGGMDSVGQQFKTYDEIAKSVKQTANSWDISAIKVGQLGSKFLELMDIENRTAEQNFTLERVIKSINAEIPGFESKINDLTSAHMYERGAIEELIGSYVKLARVRAETTAIENTMAKVFEEQYAMREKYDLLDSADPVKSIQGGIKSVGRNIDYYNKKIAETEAARREAMFEGISIPTSAYQYTDGQFDIEKTRDMMIAGQRSYGYADRFAEVNAQYDKKVAELQDKIDEAKEYRSELQGDVGVLAGLNKNIDKLSDRLGELDMKDSNMTDDFFKKWGLDLTNGDKDIDTVNTVGRIKNEVRLADEDLKMLVDMAERDYVVQVNALSPNISIDVTNENGENLNANTIADSVKIILDEQIAMHTNAVYSY